MPSLQFADLVWIEAPMPGAGSVRLARLPDIGDGAFRAFVRFAPGWVRPDTGCYAVAEEIFVLKGDLSMSGERWQAHDYAWIPASASRADSRSENGCLAFAWFSGAPRWQSAQAIDAAPGDAAQAGAPVSGPQASSPWIREMLGLAGPAARVLRASEDHVTWQSAQAEEFIAPCNLELLALADYTWTHIGPRQRVPASGIALWRSVQPVDKENGFGIINGS